MALITCADCKSQFSNEAKACPKCGKPTPNGASAGAVVLVFLAVVISVVAFKACSPSSPSSSSVRSAEAEQRKVFEAKQQLDTRIANCKLALDERKAYYATLLDESKFWEARLALGDCAEVLNDPTLREMQAGATKLSYIATARDKKTAPGDRLRAISQLQAEFPSDAAEFASLAPQLKLAADMRAAAEAKRVADADKAQRRKEGVHIGMTADEVRASSWGRPTKVNRSTYSFGVREQWVYSGGYLYFKDGVLESIQN